MGEDLDMGSRAEVYMLLQTDQEKAVHVPPAIPFVEPGTRIRIEPTEP